MPYFNHTSGYLKNNSDANYRLWINAFRNLLLAAGWTNVYTDFDPATITVPAVDTHNGVDIFESGNTDGAPIYLRVEYGTAFSISDGSMIMRVGTGYTGSNVDGVTSTTGIIMANSFQTTTNGRFSCSAGEDWLFGLMGNGGVNIGAGFLIERLRDPITRLPTNDFYFITAQPSGAGGDRYRHGAIVNGDAWYNSSSEMQTGKLGAGYVRVGQGKVGVAFILPFTYRPYPPLRTVLMVQHQAVTPVENFCYHSSYGEQCKYLQQPPESGNPFFVLGGSTYTILSRVE